MKSITILSSGIISCTDLGLGPIDVGTSVTLELLDDELLDELDDEDEYEDELDELELLDDEGDEE